MKVRLNTNKQIVKEVQEALKETEGYCPCAIVKNNDTKCMCKEFREQMSHNIEGKCHCGLYEVYDC